MKTIWPILALTFLFAIECRVTFPEEGSWYQIFRLYPVCDDLHS